VSLQAFCVFYPWRDLPCSTLVLIQSRPRPGPVNLSRNGLAACLDAAFASLEARGYTHTMFRRSADRKWRAGLLLQNGGRLGEYAHTVIEVIPAGGVSRWERVNRYVLDKRAVEQETTIVVGQKPEGA
jgi:hypothetical protein